MNPIGGASKNILWSTFDKFGGLLITFLLNLVLARFFLTPQDFGLVGMINIFISLANTTVIGGFGQAIIQSKDLSTNDINTTFSFNFFISIILYSVLFFSSPYIAKFYSTPILSDLVKISSLILIINSFHIVQNSLLIKEMQFRKLSLINNLSLISSAIITIFFAYKGLKVWCLIINTLLFSLFSTIILWITSKIKPHFAFKYKSFKRLFSFGGFMYISTLVETFYSNALYMILGKTFSPQLLGYYTQAEKLQRVPTSTIGTVVNQVTFPLFSKKQDSPQEVKRIYSLIINILSLFSTTLMTLLFGVAYPLIILLFTNKWEASVPIFQILCFAGIFTPINTASTSVIKSFGKGKLFFHLQLWKRVFALSLLIGISFIGLRALLYTICVLNITFYAINIYYTTKLLKIRYFDILQIPFKHILSNIIIISPILILKSFLKTSITRDLISTSILFLLIFFIYHEIAKEKEYIFIKTSLLKIKQKSSNENNK